MAERSKALALGTSLCGGVGSNPTADNVFFLFVFFVTICCDFIFWNDKNYRTWQDSNLRGQNPIYF